ncbi:bifunctional glycerol-3-phosphate/glycerone-phosphate O-acyltransferase GPT2 PWA37_004734 [Arxiozyma heterogenica]|uniref:bifunctional glycerol-3-phosphate/glycerone-phosphate O-acyltransferase GPT2 n=1 Tax=Arxiozyma heterogenica TaxID=278026 RepID=UPI002EDEA5BD
MTDQKEIKEDLGKSKSRAHVLQIDRDYFNPYNGSHWSISTFLYDMAMCLFNIMFTIFFREIKVRGACNMPQQGVPTILVCAPHANQFIDPSLVMLETRKLTSGRGRQACFVTAESSMKMKIVGFFGRIMGSIPVPRAQDYLEPVDPNIEIYCPDFDNEPTLIEGRCIEDPSKSPEFTTHFMAKSLLGLPDYLANAQIKEVVDDKTIILSSPFKSSNPRVAKLLKDGTNFKYAKKVDNSKVFQNVFNHLHSSGTVGIFPEGGSHDRPSLLPIKAGVAIMALGAAAADPNMKVYVVPVGLHYFHRHKFRSRAVIEYGEPIIVDGTMGQQYLESPRETTSTLLNKITESLYSVTENAPDYDTLMTIQAARRLFQSYEIPEHRLSLPLIVEINRRLLVGYSKYKEDPRIIKLKEMVTAYNDILYSYGLKDHQVEKLQSSTTKDVIRCFFLLIERLARLLVFFVLSLPGSVLFTPIFIVSNVYSKKKQREGLKKSVVKLKGLDLLATWKIIVALCLAPILYVTYSLILIYTQWLWVPSIILNSTIGQFIYFYSILVLTTYSSLKTGEIGIDLLKSLRPLFVSLFYPNDKITKLKSMRKELSHEITHICDELGPTVFPDYEKFKTLNDFEGMASLDSTLKPVQPRSRSSSIHSIGSILSNALSRVNSRGSLSDIPIFHDSRPPSYIAGSTTNREDVDSSDEEEFEDETHCNEENASELRARNQSKITNLIREKWKDQD